MTLVEVRGLPGLRLARFFGGSTAFIYNYHEGLITRSKVAYITHKEYTYVPIWEYSKLPMICVSHLPLHLFDFWAL